MKQTYFNVICVQFLKSVLEQWSHKSAEHCGIQQSYQHCIFYNFPALHNGCTKQ